MLKITPMSMAAAMQRAQHAGGARTRPAPVEGGVRRIAKKTPSPITTRITPCTASRSTWLKKCSTGMPTTVPSATKAADPHDGRRAPWRRGTCAPARRTAPATSVV